MSDLIQRANQYVFNDVGNTLILELVEKIEQLEAKITHRENLQPILFGQSMMIDSDINEFLVSRNVGCAYDLPLYTQQPAPIELIADDAAMIELSQKLGGAIDQDDWETIREWLAGIQK